MITGFYFYRRWWTRIETTITDPVMYSDESCDYLDSLYTYAMLHGINPNTLIRIVES